MNIKGLAQHCVLILLADGFEELEVLTILKTLHQAGVCVKSVGLAPGLVDGAHGLLVMPDFNLSDFCKAADVSLVDMVVLPGDEYALSRLEFDSRVHRLLRRVVECQGLIAANSKGLPVLQAALGNGLDPDANERIFLWHTYPQPDDGFARALLAKLG